MSTALVLAAAYPIGHLTFTLLRGNRLFCFYVQNVSRMLGCGCLPLIRRALIGPAYLVGHKRAVTVGVGGGGHLVLPIAGY